MANMLLYKMVPLCEQLSKDTMAMGAAFFK